MKKDYDCKDTKQIAMLNLLRISKKIKFLFNTQFMKNKLYLKNVLTMKIILI